MYVLALDTTTRDGSAALVEGDVVIEVRRGDATRPHVERLPAELLELAAAHQVSIRAIDLFAVASGPGSFTGLRIGIATMQGLALTTGRRIAAMSSLEALAQTAAADAKPGCMVGAWMDARRGDVFAAVYRVTDAPAFTPERLVEIEGPTAGRPDLTLDRWLPWMNGAEAVFVGDGAVLYAEAIRRRAGWTVLPEVPLIAGTIGRIGAALAARGDTFDPAAVHPQYVRRPDAEVERERRALTDVP